MAEKNEIHNEFSGLAATSFQIGVNNGPISVTSPSNPSGLNGTQAERLRGLAGAVRSASERELEKWGLRDRDALPVRWRTAEENLFDYWEKIGADGTPVSLAGQFTAIRKTYEAVESRRLVVLGRAGAGKTVLAHRLILDLLKNSPLGPVPVLFGLGDWNPATELRCWLAEHLARDFLFLDTRDPTTKMKLAEVFIERGLVVPVLDGFDELPEQHHAAAIRQISTLDLPLIVTSRPAEYARAAHEIKAVGGAAAIALEDLPLDKTREYLRQSTGKPRGHAWDAVFEQLRTAPGDPASRNLTAVLTSPLMVMLARTVYNDNPGHQPGELLNAAHFPEAEDLEDHLLDAYVETVYARRTGPRKSRTPNWSPGRARRWLGYLATHLQDRDTHDLTWWELPAALHRWTRILVTAAIGGIAVGTAHGFVVGAANGLADGFVGGFAVGFAVVFAVVFPAGFAAALVNEARFSRARTGREPERLRLSLSLRRRGREPRARMMTHLKESTFEFITGFAFGFAFGLALGFAGGFAYVLAYGLAVGIAFGLPSVVVSALGDTYDSRATDPWTLLTRDRTVTLVRTVATTALAVGIAYGFLAESGDVLLIGLVFGPVFGIVRLVLSAWGSWLLFARLWLPLTGRLPWRPKRFLEDAYERGVLRRTGSVYQLRHVRLRDHLAIHYRSRRRTGSQARTTLDQLP
ncbi:NACHT domain-containing protein [Saccharopolyspora griseoalba]|uniref:NACHT domain-containing protein n=1 Tax=Saccharopolyspora griseoalba TaxID=1431848 RepID=A0ABW2LBR0_9PSEU